MDGFALQITHSLFAIDAKSKKKNLDKIIRYLILPYLKIEVIFPALFEFVCIVINYLNFQ
jgi:hypothetical protein